MPSLKISALTALPAASVVPASDVLPIVNSGTTDKITVANLFISKPPVLALKSVADAADLLQAYESTGTTKRFSLDKDGRIVWDLTGIAGAERATHFIQMTSPGDVYFLKSNATSLITLVNGATQLQMYALPIFANGWTNNQSVKCTDASGTMLFSSDSGNPTTMVRMTPGSLATRTQEWTNTSGTAKAWVDNVGNIAMQGVGFFGTAVTGTKPIVTGSRGANAALASLLTTLASLGLITDSST